MLSLYWLVDANRDPSAIDRRRSCPEFFPVKLVQRAALGNSSWLLGGLCGAISDTCAGASKDPVGLDSPTFRLLGASLERTAIPVDEVIDGTALEVEEGFMVAVEPIDAPLAAAFPLMPPSADGGRVSTKSSMSELSQLPKSDSSN